MRPMEFTKMQGLGNDFVVIEGPEDLSPAEVRSLCDRRFGIGADGVLVVSPGDPVRMEYWNADGSAAEMCGNGLRCVARYVKDRQWVTAEQFQIQTPIGLRSARVLDDGIEVEVGRARSTGEAIIDGRKYHLVDVGNPHAVTIVDDPHTVDVAAVGRSVNADERFERGTNVEFVSLQDGERLAMRVWERGIGETLACGSGMVAAAHVASESGGRGSRLTVDVPGGRGSVEFREGAAWLVGPADYVFTGSVGGR